MRAANGPEEEETSPNETWTGTLPHDACISLLGFLGGSERNEPQDRSLYHSLRGNSVQTNHSRTLRMDAVRSLTREFTESGLVWIKSALSDKICDALCRAIDEDLAEALRNDKTDALDNNVKSPNARFCMKLRIERPEVSEALHALFGNEAMSNVLFGAVNDRDPELYELSVIVSDPGSKQQQFHADTSDTYRARMEDKDETVDVESTAILCTVFVAVQDIDSTMGPTMMYPRTHTDAFHRTYFGTNSSATTQLECLREQEKMSLTLRRGDVVLMNSQLLHCGGANTSTRRRRLLCISFVGRSGRRPYGSTATLYKEYRSSVFVSTFLQQKKGRLDGVVAK